MCHRPTALYYYSNENIEDSNLTFQQQSSTEAMSWIIDRVTTIGFPPFSVVYQEGQVYNSLKT